MRDKIQFKIRYTTPDICINIYAKKIVIREDPIEDPPYSKTPQ